MWKQFLTVGIGVIAAVVAVSAQGTTSGRPSEFIFIGCLESAPNGFMMRDVRSGTRYRLDGTAEMLGWHVGHELEIRGTFQSSPTGDTPTLKVTSVVYIAQKCSQAPPPTRR